MIKVTDLIPYKESMKTEADQVIKNLLQLSRDYRSTTDPFQLETIKREFVSELQFMASIYSRIKSFKGGTHSFLEREYKKLKAETLGLLQKEGVNVTAAEKICYNHEYYLDRSKVLRRISEHFNEVELLYDLFCQTLQCMTQSISVSKIEYEYSRQG